MLVVIYLISRDRFPAVDNSLSVIDEDWQNENEHEHERSEESDEPGVASRVFQDKLVFVEIGCLGVEQQRLGERPEPDRVEGRDSNPDILGSVETGNGNDDFRQIGVVDGQVEIRTRVVAFHRDLEKDRRVELGFKTHYPEKSSVIRINTAS